MCSFYTEVVSIVAVADVAAAAEFDFRKQITLFYDMTDKQYFLNNRITRQQL